MEALNPCDLRVQQQEDPGLPHTNDMPLTETLLRLAYVSQDAPFLQITKSTTYFNIICAMSDLSVYTCSARE